MGKYRLKSRQAGSVITLMEIDTESRAWYIKADHKEAALKALKDMGPALACVETIYINGDDVSSVVFAPAPMMDSDIPPVDFPPPEEPIQADSLAPGKNLHHARSNFLPIKDPVKIASVHTSRK